MSKNGHRVRSECPHIAIEEKLIRALFDDDGRLAVTSLEALLHVTYGLLSEIREECPPPPEVAEVVDCMLSDILRVAGAIHSMPTIH